MMISKRTSLFTTVLLTSALIAGCGGPEQEEAQIEAASTGNNPVQLAQSGWTCFIFFTVHCLNTQASAELLVLKVFSGTDVNDENATFLGTEHVLPADRYSGQPCPQDNLETYAPLDLSGDGVTDFYACHHYEQ